MGLRLLQTIYASTYGIPSGRSAKFYRDAEWEEYRVKFYVHGVYQENADYCDSDGDAASDTMFHWISQPPTVVVEETGEEIFL